nr:SUMF1/EgtB/PvdO family nonheme iron enzyme [Spirochaetota bacterium]
WATTTGGYTFANAGVQGDSGAGTNQHPVTTINWRDSMVWCNALTEYYNANNGTDADLDCVYYTDSGSTTPIRAATDSTTITWDLGSVYSGTEDEPYVKSTAKGFRLPGSMEWECAARYRGSDTTNSILNTGVYWTKGNSASGATDYAYTTADNPLDTAGESGPSRTVAWYSINSGLVTKPVAGKTANALGMRDMSGNVWEWCFDWYPEHSGSSRVLRGGSWDNNAYTLQVGYVYDSNPYIEDDYIGFRFVRTQ